MLNQARSTPWRKKKPSKLLPLDTYGLPSKGETRLHSFETQEQYYTAIVDRFLSFCTDAEDGQELLMRFGATDLSAPVYDGSDTTATLNAAIAALTLSQPLSPWPDRTTVGPCQRSGPGPGPPSSSSTRIPHVSRATSSASQTASIGSQIRSRGVSLSGSWSAGSGASTPVTMTAATTTTPASRTIAQDMPTIMFAHRKLREGIIASGRTDVFAAQAYLFGIRLAVLCKHPDTYHPALLHLLRVIDRHGVLLSPERREAVAYLILDAACRRGQLEEAVALRRRHRQRDPRGDMVLRQVDGVLHALIHGNWALFWKLKASMYNPMTRLIDYADERMRTLALAAIGKSYFSVSLSFVERATDASWQHLREHHDVAWELDPEGTVRIRKVPRSRGVATASSG